MKPKPIISAISVAAAIGFSSLAIADHGDVTLNPNVRKTQVADSPMATLDAGVPARAPSVGVQGNGDASAARRVNAANAVGAQPNGSVRTSRYQRDDSLNVPGNPAFGRIGTP